MDIITQIRPATKRECPNCLKQRHTYYGCDVLVVPHYESHITSTKDPLSLHDYYNLIITETFICPECGEVIKEDYVVGLTQEDMQTMVDREVASRKK